MHKLFLLLLAICTLQATPSKYGLEPLTIAEQEHLERDVEKVIEVKPSSSKQFRTVKASTNLATLMITNTRASLPASVDNSLLPSFPPIADQGHLGSCVAFGSTYYQASHEIGLLNGYDNKTSLTHVLSPKWTYNLVNNGRDNGLSVPAAYQLLAVNGAASLPDFPYDSNYTAWSLDVNTWIAAIYNRCAPYVLIPGLGGDLTAIKTALTAQHVLTFATFIDSWVFTRIKRDPTGISTGHEGEYAAVYMNGTKGGHFMTIVGYDDTIWIDVNGNGAVDTNERGAFLVANSWGTDWGNNGFIWVSYDAFRTSSAVPGGPNRGRVAAGAYLNSCVIALNPKAQNYHPSLIGEFSLSQTYRNQISISIGALGTTIPIPALSNQGGSFAFDGTRSSSSQTATFAVDFTDLIPSAGFSPNQRYFLSIGDTVRKNPTTLTSFELVDLTHSVTTVGAMTPKTYDNSSGQVYIDYNYSLATIPPPSLTITAPSDGAILNGNKTLSASSTTTLTSLSFYLDSTLLTTLTSAPYTYTLRTGSFPNGSHQITAIGTDSSDNTLQSSLDIQIQNIALYTNTGGPTLTSQGKTWTTDQGLYAGSTQQLSSPASFANPVYKTARAGKSMTYTYNLPNGRYLITLKFCELQFKARNKRSFNASINGTTVINRLDLFATVGFNRPYDLTFPVTISNGTLTLQFSAQKDNALINAIQILSNP